MRLTIKYILSLIVMTATHALSMSQVNDDMDEAIRLNPELSISTGEAPVKCPGFINYNANNIEYNGADWSALRHKAASTITVPLSIVHIGDSHIQADFATGLTRQLFQETYGNPGRGLIIPFRMAGTNEPRDYTIKGNGQWKSSKLMKQHPDLPVGFTGVSVSPSSDNTELSVSTLSQSDKHDLFNDITLYCTGTLSINAVSCDGYKIAYEVLPYPGAYTIMLAEPVSEILLSVSFSNDAAIYGADLRLSGQSGVLYHAIGNNGATYASYSAINGFADGLSILNPDLVIISLGANEAFGNTTDSDIYKAIDTVVTRIMESNPLSEILLVTPMECQKSTRSRKNRRARGYVINDKVAVMREAILRYGRDKNIATYDWYAIAGGEGISTQWVKEGLMAKDRIHHSYEGYRLNGQLLYDALNKALQQ